MQAARQSLVDHGRRPVAGGYVVGADGNLSVRFGDVVLITPSGVPYDRVAPEQVASIDLDGLGDASRSSEWAVHCAIYRARLDVMAIVHCAYLEALDAVCSPYGASDWRRCWTRSARSSEGRWRWPSTRFREPLSWACGRLPAWARGTR